jgi:VWFA-related protein
VREGTLKYIREQISDTDTVALFAVTSGLQLLQPFTQDKTKLMSAVEKAYASSTSSKGFEQRDLSENITKQREALNGSEAAGAITTAAGGSTAAQAMIAARVLQQYVKLRSALSVQQSRPILAALAAICEAQRSIPGKKTLVLFSQGFVAPAVLDWQVQSTIDIANRANVAIYIIDSAGLREGGTRSGALVPSSPLAGISAISSQEQRIQAVGGDTVFDNVRHEGLNREYDILYRIADDTGGKFIKGSNDISQGLGRIDQEIRARYTLAYRSTDQNFDGTFRKLKVEVRRPEAQVISRSGYYAIAHEDIVPLSPGEKRLLAHFAETEASTTLPMFVELSSFRSREGLYTVPVSIEVPPAGVKFGTKGNKQLLQLDIFGVIRNAQDKILSRVGGSFDVALSAEQYQSIVSNNIFYRQDLELPAGTYNVDLAFRDRLSGKVAARRQKLLLPEMDSEFATSPVLLSRHAAPSKGTTSEADILSPGGVQIRPSPSHEFHVNDNLIIFFQLYNAATNVEMAKPLVRVTVTLMKENKAATRPIDYVLTDVDNHPVPHLTFAKYISLKGLPTGAYTARIEAQDMVTHKVVRQDASFLVAQ